MYTITKYNKWISPLTILVISIFILSFSSTLSFAQVGGGNGGDTCENRFNTIRENISSWIKAGNYQELVFNENESSERYKKLMLTAIDSATVSCTTDKVIVNGVEKTCKNEKTISGTSMSILCNYDRFLNPHHDPEFTQKEEEDSQYILVHHELAGLADFEVNFGKKSDYHLSNQISKKLEFLLVKKLPIEPQNTGIGMTQSVSNFLSASPNFDSMNLLGSWSCDMVKITREGEIYSDSIDDAFYFYSTGYSSTVKNSGSIANLQASYFVKNNEGFLSNLLIVDPVTNKSILGKIYLRKVSRDKMIALTVLNTNDLNQSSRRRIYNLQSPFDQEYTITSVARCIFHPMDIKNRSAGF